MIRPSSKVIIKFLSVMQKHGYIGEFEEVDDHSQWQDCHPAQRTSQQDRCHLSPLQRSTSRSREVGCQAVAFSSIWLHCPYAQRWYYGPRGGSTKACCWKGHWLLLLDIASCDMFCMMA